MGHVHCGEINHSLSVSGKETSEGSCQMLALQRHLNELCQLQRVLQGHWHTLEECPAWPWPCPRSGGRDQHGATRCCHTQWARSVRGAWAELSGAEQTERWDPTAREGQVTPVPLALSPAKDAARRKGCCSLAGRAEPTMKQQNHHGITDGFGLKCP